MPRTVPDTRRDAARFGLPALTDQADLDLRDRACRSLDRDPWLTRIARRLDRRLHRDRMRRLARHGLTSWRDLI